MPAYKRGEYKKFTKTCEYCGTEFQGVNAARYCSSNCRVYVFRAKKKAEKNKC